jgi:hypothetical protein
VKWYKHDSDATQDAKIKKLILKHGTDGYAVFFHCLELIAGDVSESNVSFELEHDAEIIADNLKIKSDPDRSAIDKVNDIMKMILSLELFEESQGRISCLKMAKRIDASMVRNIQIKNIKESVKISENHGKALPEENRREENRTDKNRDNSSEPSPVSEPVFSLPLIPSHGYYKVTAEQVTEWADTFPAVNVLQELKLMKAWCEANPTRKKTSSGAQKFIVNWLSRTQNNGGNRKVTPLPQATNTPPKVEYITSNKNWKEIMAMFDAGKLDEQAIVNLKETRMLDDRDAGFLLRKLRGEV